MANYQLCYSSLYYDGVTVGKDVDGVFLIDPVLNGQIVLTPFLRTVPTRKLMSSAVWDNGATVDKENDGGLVIGEEPIESGNTAYPFSLTPVAPREIFSSPLYNDGVTIGIDQDGVIAFDSSADIEIRGPARRFLGSVAAASGSATAAGTGRLKKQALVSVSGSATASATGRFRFQAVASVAGEASAVAAAILRLQAAASISGSATASATAILIVQISGYSNIVFFGTAELIEALLGEDLPSLIKNYYSGEALAPLEAHTVNEIGDPTVSNKLVVISDSSLILSPSYSGVAYSFGGPAEDGSAPYKLGFVHGDKLKLYGPTGTEPNHGKVFTFENPDALTIMETMTTPDATEYEFVVFRRLP
jgi:hypothetical protein